MFQALILAASLLALPVSSGRDAGRRGSGDESAQTAAAQEKPTTDATANRDAKPSESNPEETPSDKKAEAGSQVAPANQPATGVRRHRSRTKKPVVEGEPRKTVIRHGSASEPVVQILPGISQEEAERQRESAEQLLVSSAASLKELTTRDLNTNQRDTVVQIRQYMDVAHTALEESDIQRAHTLALKAYLLADDLAKHEK